MIGSKEGQDLFVQHFIPQPGYFLDIGSGHPLEGNNTYNLEQAGWKGILIERDESNIKLTQQMRSNPAHCLDLSTFMDWNELLADAPKIIDYISLDVDNANPAFMLSFPFDEYEFKILTYETDFYWVGDRRKQPAIDVLSKYGFYEMLVEDVMFDGQNVFEDWWVNTKYIPMDRKCKTIYWKDFIDYTPLM